MKKSKSFLMGILGVMLVFGMIATGCPTDPDPGPTTYTVTFDTDGGSAVPDQTVEEGKKVTKP
ncbi:MAG: InlB B-repeat-containing protein, partial [Treponema sp.]|nr:InlB B-repeat-containing protein [Treponema sp.]